MVAKVKTSTEDEETAETGDSDAGSSGGSSNSGSSDSSGSGGSSSSGSGGSSSSGPSLVDQAIKTATQGVPFAGGTITPAKVGKGYGAQWSMQFSKGGKVAKEEKVSKASKRADGIAQRGKTKGRYL